jgi:nucleoside-diphosphate-sugar epimerase
MWQPSTNTIHGSINTSDLSEAHRDGYIADSDEVLLVTGANGFIGSRVVRTLLSYGFTRVRCFARPTSALNSLKAITKEFGKSSVEIVSGNLTSREDCQVAIKDVSVVFHLAAGTDKTFPGCFLDSVVTTQKLLSALVNQKSLKRFVNVSSLAVYSNEMVRRGGVIDESCEVDTRLVERHDPYAYAKAKQDELVLEHARTRGLPYVIVRPGVTFGPGKAKIPGRVGMDTFGVFLHLGLNNRLPLTYVDNCAEAIVLAGLRKGINAEVINVIDDDLPRSREFLRAYKERGKSFVSIPMPYPAFFLLSYLWEKYSKYSEGQLPPVFNRRACAAYYGGNTYSNKKAKELLGWQPRVEMRDALERFFAYAREMAGSR